MMMVVVATCIVGCNSMQWQSNTENPRGIYKMTTLIGNAGEVEAPFDQYKICTDSITLTAAFDKDFLGLGRYSSMIIRQNDRQTFNYTGEAPDPSDSTASRIYDSNSDHFTLKWWSSYTNHVHFPKDDWCIEKYEANLFSEDCRPIFDLILNPAPHDDACPIVGTWLLLTIVDSLEHWQRIDEKPRETDFASIANKAGYGSFVIISHQSYCDITVFSSAWSFIDRHRAVIADDSIVIYDNIVKNNRQDEADPSVQAEDSIRTETRHVIWLSPNRVAIRWSDRIGTHHDYIILERVNDSSPFINRLVNTLKNGDDLYKDLVKYQTDKELEQCPAFEGIDFPAFTASDTVFNSKFLIEEYTVEHRMQFEKLPSDAFYTALDAACKSDHLWQKSDDGNTYHYSYKRATDDQNNGPDGYDRLELIINRDSLEFKLCYGKE